MLAMLAMTVEEGIVVRKPGCGLVRVTAWAATRGSAKVRNLDKDAGVRVAMPGNPGVGIALCRGRVWLRLEEGQRKGKEKSKAVKKVEKRNCGCNRTEGGS